MENNEKNFRLNKQPCAFITAHRDECPNAENKIRNEALEGEIKKSGLSYIKAAGQYAKPQDGAVQAVTEYLFCVIDNKYHLSDFEKLAIKWRGDYSGGSVLITRPAEIPYGKGDENYRKSIPVVGTEYDKEGKVTKKYSSVSSDDIVKYFSGICGKDLVITDSTEHITETKRDIYKPSNAPYIHKLFKDDYPELTEADK